MTTLFTEEDHKKLTKLPSEKQSEFVKRTSDLQLRKMVADSNWEKAIDELSEDTEKLTKDIKESLAKV
jgi:hypothetical protein